MTSRFPRMRTIIAAAVATLAVTTAGACGNGSSKSTATSTPQQIVLSAATKTTAATSSKFALDVALKGVTDTGSSTPPRDMTITGIGAFDFAQRTGTMTMTLPIDQNKPTSLEVVIVGNTIYEKLPDDIVKAAAGKVKPWIKIDVDKLGELGGVDVSTIASAQSSDPSQALAYLRGASTDVKELGKETLRGTETTHYRFTVDLHKAAAAAPDAQRAALEKLAELYGGKPLPTEAWIDADGLLRKMTYSVDLSTVHEAGKPSEATGTAATTFELFDFGTKVEAVAPPANLVTDMSELFTPQSSAISNSGSSIDG